MQFGKDKGNIGILWLAAHNPEIDWEKGKVKMIQCSPICGKKKAGNTEEKTNEKDKGRKNSRRTSA